MTSTNGVAKPSYNRYLQSKFYKKFKATYPERSLLDSVDFAISSGFATEEELFYVIRSANEAPSYAEAIGFAAGILLTPFAILLALLTLGGSGGRAWSEQGFDYDSHNRSREDRWNRRYKASPYQYHGDEVESFFSELN